MTRVICTHSGSFHADDVFGVAVLAAVFPDHEIIRTRDTEAIARADFVVDVGGVWDAARGRFDHHQRGFDGGRTRVDPDGRRVDAEQYASAGLVWREFGAAYVARVAQDFGHSIAPEAAAQIASDLDATLVRYLDLVDNGAADVAPGVFGLSSQVSLLNSTWLEEQGLDADAVAALQFARFREGMSLVDRVLRRFVLRSVGQALAADTVRKSERLLDDKVLLMRAGGMPWTRVVLAEMPEVLLVIYPENGREQWQIRTVPAAEHSFASRMDLPASWAGLRDEQLAAETGVPDAVFCHANRFIAGARTLEGALQFARLALHEHPGMAHNG